MSRVILGRKKSGKTTLAKKFLAAAGPSLVIDPNDEHKIEKKTGDIMRLLSWLKEPLAEHVAYIPLMPERDDFNTLCGLVWELSIPHFHVEEVADFIPREKDNNLLLLARRDRHRGIMMTTTSQRPTEIPPAMTANNDLYIFHMTRAADLAWCEATVPDFKSFADRLGPHECIVHHGDTDDVHILPAAWKPGRPVRRLTLGDVDPKLKAAADGA